MVNDFNASLQSIDQLLLQWQANHQSWNQLLLQVFGRCAPVDLNSIAIELLDATTMAGLRGGYAPIAPDGDERIYINADWLKSASNAEIEAVLLEELGHAIDHKLSGSSGQKPHC